MNRVSSQPELAAGSFRRLLLPYRADFCPVGTYLTFKQK